MANAGVLEREVVLVGRYYDPATGQFLSVDPLVESTQQPYQYSNDDPVNLKDPTGLWWCLAQGVSGPCPAGYTNSPPYGMSNPQPPNSQVQAGGNGTYQLTLSDGETFTYTTNGGIVGGETAATGQAPCNPNSTTTNQEWLASLGAGFVTSGGAIGGAELAGAGIEGLQAISDAYAAGEISAAAFVGASIASGGLILVGGGVVAGTVWLLHNYF